MDIFEQVLGSIAGGHVLDIATSRGGFVGELQKYLSCYTTITGIDVDAHVLDTARGNFKEEAIQFMLMDAAQMGFENDRFDTISASATLHHLPDVGHVLGEINRVLKPGGTFIFIEMYREAQTEAQRTVVQMHHWAADIDTARGVHHNKTFARQKLVDFIESMGLENLVMHDFPKIESDPMDAESIKHCEDAIDMVVQRAVGLPQYEIFKMRSEELRKRLHEKGAQWEPVLFAIGQKPSPQLQENTVS